MGTIATATVETKRETSILRRATALADTEDVVRAAPEAERVGAVQEPSMDGFRTAAEAAERLEEEIQVRETRMRTTMVEVPHGFTMICSTVTLVFEKLPETAQLELEVEPPG